MQTISQLGMMFAHGNSPGAAFCLLLLGTGVNLGTLWWLTQNYGWRSTPRFGLQVVFVVVVTSAYVINKPLIPPGVNRPDIHMRLMCTAIRLVVQLR